MTVRRRQSPRSASHQRCGKAPGALPTSAPAKPQERFPSALRQSPRSASHQRGGKAPGALPTSAAAKPQERFLPALRQNPRSASHQRCGCTHTTPAPWSYMPAAPAPVS
eukprot:363417-Chlamydomonas_euryale.AAC.2